MIVTTPITRTDDVLAALRDGYLLVVEKDQAFLVDGQFAQASSRSNLPVGFALAETFVRMGDLRELTKEEVKSGGCRPLHFHRKPKVYALKG